MREQKRVCECGVRMNFVKEYFFAETKFHSMRQFAGIQYGDDADGYHQRGQQGGYQAAVLFDEEQGIEIDAEREQRHLRRRSEDNGKQYATKDDARHKGCNDGSLIYITKKEAAK